MAACAITAAAEGYQVNTLSARQGGMAHTGVAQKLGAESMYFNPAGMAFMDNTFDLAGSFNAVFPTASVTSDGKKYETDNNASTPIMAGAAFSIYDNLKAGVSFYTPYGSGINWGQSWPGAVLNEKVNLKAYTVQPTISWRILPNLAVGAGLTISWGSVDLYKGIVTPETYNNMIKGLIAGNQLPANTPLFTGTTPPASINLNGTSAVAAGANIGVMWDISNAVSVGAQFRTQTNLTVKKGIASLDINAMAQEVLEQTAGIGAIDRANFRAEMPMPWVLTFGAAYKPVSKLLLALDCQLTGWSAYKQLDVEFEDPSVAQFNQYIQKKYSNSWAFRLGAQYSITDRFDVRAGVILDLSPVNKKYYNPETPGMTKIEPSVGFTFRPMKNLGIDVAVLYVKGLGLDGASCEYNDLITTRKFVGDYKVSAFVPSIGINYSFDL